MPTISTSIEINKPIKKVTGVFFNFADHATWDPFVERIHNVTAEKESRTTTKVGDQLEVTIHPPNGNAMPITPVVTEVSDTVLAWKGTLLSELMFVGNHKFEFKAIDANTTLLDHEEQFAGLLTSPILYFVGANTELGFNNLNKALKKQVEALP